MLRRVPLFATSIVKRREGFIDPIAGGDLVASWLKGLDESKPAIDGGLKAAQMPLAD